MTSLSLLGPVVSTFVVIWHSPVAATSTATVHSSQQSIAVAVFSLMVNALSALLQPAPAVDDNFGDTSKPSKILRRLGKVAYR